MSEKEPAKRPEKKSETIEVRVSYSEKLAFMEACKQAGTTASHAIRGYIGDVLDPDHSAKSKKARIWTVLVAATIALLAAALFWQTTQSSAPTTVDRILASLDHNDDGVITADDATSGPATDKATITWLLSSMDADEDGIATPEEIGRITNVTIELRGDRPKGLSPRQENVVVVPPGLSEAERKQFIDQAMAQHHVNTEDLERLVRLLDALAVSQPD